MKAKDYLLQVRRINKLIELKQNEINKLNLYLGVKAVNYEGERVQSSNTMDRTDLICKIVDFEIELKEYIKQLIDLKKEIMQTIDKLDDADLIKLLYLRYFDFKTWEEIAITMNYSYRWILKLHGISLQKIEKILQQDTPVHILL